MAYDKSQYADMTLDANCRRFDRDEDGSVL